MMISLPTEHMREKEMIEGKDVGKVNINKI